MVSGFTLVSGEIFKLRFTNTAKCNWTVRLIDLIGIRANTNQINYMEKMHLE